MEYEESDGNKEVKEEKKDLVVEMEKEKNEIVEKEDVNIKINKKVEVYKEENEIRIIKRSDEESKKLGISI